MKKAADRKRATSRAQRAEDEMRAEYDFSNAKPNPYAARFMGDVRIVVLDPDVASSFPDAASVNDALRALVRIARRPPKKPTSKRRTA